jgi:hypothetical protein
MMSGFHDRRKAGQSAIDGRYHLVRRIGFGGMGKVFEANDI